MASADYLQGSACGHKELLDIIVGWCLSPDNSGGVWTKIQDYTDDTLFRKDGERNVILKSQIHGELPIYIGLRTFTGYKGKFQQGIQINGYTNFDPDLPWDCQAGSLADPNMYDPESHFYEHCPAILAGGETMTYWIKTDRKCVNVVARVATLPMQDNDTTVKKSVVYEHFYLGWLKRMVPKEGFPYPMSVVGTTYTLGNAVDGYVQRNFMYNHEVGACRHIPAFHHNYMMTDGIQPMVYVSHKALAPGQQDAGNSYRLASALDYLPSRFPGELKKGGDPVTDYCPRSISDVPTKIFPENPVCGPDLGLCAKCLNDVDIKLHDTEAKIKMFQYDVPQMANRALYFDGTWGWTCTMPIRNSFMKSLCHCLINVAACQSHNAFKEMGDAPHRSVLPHSGRKDQVAANFGWIPNAIVDSLSNHRLAVPVFVGIVGSLAEMQSRIREEFANSTIPQKEMYAREQQAIQIGGIMEGVFVVPGLGLAAQDVLKIVDNTQTVIYLVVPDIYRDGPANYCAILLGVKEWHDANPDTETPTA